MLRDDGEGPSDPFGMRPGSDGEKVDHQHQIRRANSTPPAPRRTIADDLIACARVREAEQRARAFDLARERAYEARARARRAK